MTNPHQSADNAHVRVKALCADLEQDLHQMVQAIDNRAALARHWEDVADAQRAKIEGLRRGILEALRYEVEENMQRFGPMADRLRALAGLPPEEPPPITETMAALREVVGDRYDGIDPIAYVAELRGDDVEELQREIITLESEKASLSAHLETVASERDELMRRVMELEKQAKKEMVRT